MGVGRADVAEQLREEEETCFANRPPSNRAQGFHSTFGSPPSL